MEWPTWLQAELLFPSLSDPSAGFVPSFEPKTPVWSLLDPSSEHGLKAQLDRLPSMPSSVIEHVVMIGEGIRIDPTATIEPFVTIFGPCYIGPQVTIRSGAYVREYSWLCEGSIVGHSTEIKHSTLLPHAKAPHFNYVGDSILGSHVNLGAGTKLSNLRNDGTEVFVRFESGRFGSGLRKFGAILGEGCALGCNAVTNPGVVLGPHSNVWPNTTVTGIHRGQSTHK
jgi:NDP-sugar pyrophosphorylase family protein